MSNIKEIKNTTNVQTHINKAYEFLDHYLPNPYTKKTQDLLLKNGIEVSISTINNVRNRNNERVDVLNVLLMIAKYNKAEVDKLKKLVNS